MTIFIHAYRSFSARYILGTDIFRALKSSGNRLIIFVKDDELDHFKGVFQDPQIEIEPVLYQEGIQLLRRSLLVRSLNLVRIMTAGSQPGFRNSTVLMRRIQYKKEFKGTKGKLVYAIITMLSRITCASYLARKLLSKLLYYTIDGKLYDHFFDKYRPNTLIISSLGYGIDIPFMNSAKRNNCTIISVPHSWDNSSTTGYRGSEPNKVITWNNTMAREVEGFHDINPQNVYAGGIAHWDKYSTTDAAPPDRVSFCENHSLDPNKKILFYPLSGPRHYERRFDVIEGILKSIKSRQIIQPSQLLVRFHPLYIEPDKNGVSLLDHNLDVLNKIKKEYGEIVKFWTPKRPHMNKPSTLSMEDMLSMAHAIQISDLIIQEYSTLILESTVFDKPLINISMYLWEQDLPSEALMKFKHLNHVFQYGSLRNARSFEEFIKIANQYLANPSLDHKERKKLFNTEVNINFGSAGNKIGKYIIENLSA